MKDYAKNDKMQDKLAYRPGRPWQHAQPSPKTREYALVGRAPSLRRLDRLWPRGTTDNVVAFVQREGGS
jgi:hypothetical protein